MTAPYSRYASIYDRTGQSAFSLHAWRRIHEQLTELGWRGQDLAELACGTGALAVKLADQGYLVTGIDRAREMLLQARCRPTADRVRWVQGEFAALPLADESLDLATALYDSLNYLRSAAELKHTLAELRRVLRPGGMAVFDLNTPATLRLNWSGICQARADQEIATIWQARWLPTEQVSTLQATFFVRAADGRYDRFDETHDERGFTATELAEGFTQAGLRLRLAEDQHTGRRPDNDTKRVFYYLQRPAETRR